MLYLIGFPFLGYYVLKKQQGKFGNDQALFRYGMFISGYREGFYHWESVVASRKAVFIGSSIFSATAAVFVHFSNAASLFVAGRRPGATDPER